MATLAIKGHSTRGEEVIELLEMLGGWNYNRWDSKTSRTLYFINENVIELTNIRHDTCINEFNVFTLEEFEEQYPYKVGDNVTHHVGKLLETHKIIGMRWDSDKCRILYYLDNYDVIGVEDILYGIECKIEQSIKNNDNLTINSEEFEEKFPYKIGDKVLSHNKWEGIIIDMEWSIDDIVYHIRENTGYISHQSVNELQPYKEDTVEEEEEDFAECIEKTIQECLFGKEDMEDKGNISDGYHTFNELYEYRLLYNASMFNELAKQGLYDVHKSKRHSDATIPFGDENWFIVQAELPTGQISNHYEMKDWDLFQVPIKEKANPYDGHTPQDVAKRLREFLTPKPKYPKTFAECCKVLGITSNVYMVYGYDDEHKTEVDYLYTQKMLANHLVRLKICRDAYWKIAGEEMGFIPWKPDWDNLSTNHEFIKIKKGCFEYSSRVLVFPTAEMRDVFYENFKELIEICKELL